MIKLFETLPLFIFSNQKLDNQIGKEGAIALAQGVQLNNTLELLDLESIILFYFFKKLNYNLN